MGETNGEEDSGKEEEERGVRAEIVRDKEVEGVDIGIKVAGGGGVPVVVQLQMIIDKY